MSRIISLDEYRHALRRIEERKIIERWKGPRFFDVDFMEYFSVPYPYGYEAIDLILMKVTPNGACACGRLADGLGAFMFPNREVPIRFDLPVIRYQEENLPPE